MPAFAGMTAGGNYKADSRRGGRSAVANGRSHQGQAVACPLGVLLGTELAGVAHRARRADTVVDALLRLLHRRRDAGRAAQAPGPQLPYSIGPQRPQLDSPF